MQQRDREVFLSILLCMKFTLPLVILINILCLGNVVGIYTTLGNPSLVEGLKKLCCNVSVIKLITRILGHITP